MSGLTGAWPPSARTLRHDAVDQALGQAATAGRFADGDLAAIMAHQACAGPGEAIPGRRAAHAGPGHQRMGTPRRPGGSPMTPATTIDDGKPVVLSSSEAAYLR